MSDPVEKNPTAPTPEVTEQELDTVAGGGPHVKVFDGATASATAEKRPAPRTSTITYTGLE